MKDKRITLKFLGTLMETCNVSPGEFRKTLWHIALALGVLCLFWRSPELITAIAQASKP